MKILMVTSRFFPDSPGGTEVYVASLCQHLVAQGIQVAVAAPKRGLQQVSRSSWEDIPVVRYPVSPTAQRMASANQPCTEQRSLFAEILLDQRPDVLHLHTWGGLAGVNEFAAASASGIPTLLTVHHPLLVCPRGSALQWGTFPCPAPTDLRVCGACLLQSRGMPIPLSRFLSNALESYPKLGRIVGFPARAIAAVQRKRALWAGVAGFVTPARWLIPLLRMHDVLPERIHYIPQALCHPLPRNVRRTAHERVILGFLGRCKPLKGLDLLIAAVRRLPGELKLEVRVHCSVDADDAQAASRSVAELQASAISDSRIRFLPPLAPQQVLQEIAQWDALIIPSRVQECAPLVALEAFAVGVPVIGADCGGIAELVTHEQSGLLFRTGSVASLAEQLHRYCSEPELASRLRRAIPKVPDSRSLAQAMIPLYNSTLTEKGEARVAQRYG